MNRTVINKSTCNNQTNISPDIYPAVNNLLAVTFLNYFSNTQNNIVAGMININIQQHILAAIKEVTPEMEQGVIDVDEDIRKECDLNSLEFQSYLNALNKSTGVSIDKDDYNQVNTFNKMLGYLSEKLSI